MFNPVSTYRIQFNHGYTFRDFLRDADYFLSLGISSIYASPVFEATPGSMHGYDVTDPLRINPEIGNDDDFLKISDTLRKHNAGWIQDIVPNHLAFHNNNEWLMDVLENGQKSEYAKFFDIDFSHPEFNGKIMVPFLGKPLRDVLGADEIKAELFNGKPVFSYYDFVFPFNKESISELSGSVNAATTLDQVEMINSDKKRMEHTLSLQNYELCYWKESLNRLNYRRFFTVNSLICLSMENDRVFEKYHEFINRNITDKRFNGLRIDHIDGLQNPDAYLEKLRLMSGDDTYLVIEKILGPGEKLPFSFPIQGTTGYDFLGMVNNLFTKQANYQIFKDFYRGITGIIEDPEELIFQSKKSFLTSSMRGEWENLAAMYDSSFFVTYTSEVNRESIKEAIGEFLVLFPVYRLYGDSFPLSSEEAGIIGEVFMKAVVRRPELEKALFMLRDVFLEYQDSDEKREKALLFFRRCMQFTGPLMAKGVEDTLMYHYNCFISHNEVGDHPAAFGISVDRFHEHMTERQKNSPLSMNATSTHDTKRGEDARARLNVISELPGEWTGNVRKWIKINSASKEIVKGITAPDPNEEYFIYQTLTAVFPFDGKAGEAFLERIDQYLEKALREGKRNSDWNEINEEYENAVKGFTRKILKRGSPFLKSFIPFQKKIARYGVINSISQLFLKVTSPGIPDFYQGTELWDLSLVDPDNRRPVDYSLRKNILSRLQTTSGDEPEILLRDLFKTYENGRIKLLFTRLLLEERKANPDLFHYGTYIPLKTEGRYREHVLAFARVYKDSWFISVVPLFLASIDARTKDPSRINWRDTTILLPDFAPVNWTSLFIKGNLRLHDRIPVSEILKLPLPFFIKGSRRPSSRYAGVLAHVSSLPGKYGSGDLGPEAYSFADMLRSNGQSYWQMLPFNAVEEGLGWSPYSSVSAFAGNTIFLSPDLFVREGLLNAASLKMTAFSESSEADFGRALDFRNLISEEVFTNFFCRNRPLRHAEFEKFCERQASWLDDFAMFIILKRENGNVSWSEWPKKYRNRSKKTIEVLSEKFAGDLRREKLMQYLFDKQWLALKRYCNERGIKLIGDISFYVNYNSADVWAHPEYFKLDSHKMPVTVAGVPPDYFSETGQLWNMPVYDWDRLQKDGYSWWMRRIRRNLELSDVVRFDHFRAFSEYWEVPFGEKTAVNGQWTPGPGHDFFRSVKKEYPGMPFIAEDLGSIDEKVYRLRNDFKLPGMAVLQFAFDDNTPRSGYIPHNFTPDCIVYTGTHDNNTIKGWYMNELEDKYRMEASEYAGHKIDEDTCHMDFIRMAYGSVAKVAIIPVQDLLGLDGSARLNMPSTSKNNWTWKMKRGDMEKIFSPEIRRMIELYGRY